MPKHQREHRTLTVLRYLWAAPATCLGGVLALVGVAGGGRIALRDGVIEAEGRLLKWGLTHLTLLQHGVSAITFGHVVLGRDRESLDQTRSHERVHVRQYERWGPLFIPLYLTASAWAAASGKDPYNDNCFERAARELDEQMPAGRVNRGA
jgi:hypothetical protein